jgi:glycosyltransferase involved in cell wall biosynthesis
VTLVSVALATYNGERYLPELLDSLLAQTHRDLEVCASDDASTDRSVAILQEYAARDPRVRVMANATNRGYQQNFQIAVSMCRGEYVALCDQDDVWLPHKVERLLSEMGDNLLVASDATVVDSNLRPIGQTLARVYQLSGQRWSFLSILLKNRFTGCTMMFRQELVQWVRPFPAHTPHDWWLTLVAIDRRRFSFIPEELTLYRQHSSNVIGVLEVESEYAKIRSRAIPGMSRISAYHARKLMRYREIRALMTPHHISATNLRNLDRLIDFHAGFFRHSFRPRAVLTSIWMTRHIGDRVPLISLIGRAAKAAVGIRRPELLERLSRQTDAIVGGQE